MTTIRNMKLLEELSLTPAISGNEEKMREIISRELESCTDEIETDEMGNLITTKKGEEGAPTVMLASHMDEIGLMVKYIDDNGFIKFIKIGGINDQMLINQAVIIHSANGKVPGVIGSKPPHVTKPEERNKVIKYTEMFIDIGANNKEEAEEMVSIGDMITFRSFFEEYPNNKVMGKALDNRIGCYVMMEVMKRVESRATIYGVGTVQEEVGLKGAKVSSYTLNPDYAFALDTTLCGDHPGITIEEAPCKMGEGPAVILADRSGDGIITPKVMKDMIINASKKNDIGIQLEVSDGGTTDGTAIHLNREGITTGVISVPTRYIHTPVSVASAEDIENTIELMLAILNNI
ncbi:M42 family metallopeptidase [Methanosphaera sp. ISO3-F5]|uniref:M42 family metallopeptidase n=1 Tax=Methanosphaera sp. ISO3-F5 TaxID=1452353 RepID=UPI00396488C2